MFLKGRNKIYVVLILACMVAIFAACSKAKDEKGDEATPTPAATEKANASTSAPEASKEKAEISYYVNEITFGHLAYGIQWPDIQEKANVKINLINAGNRDNYAQTLDLLMASGDKLPDTLWMKVDTANKYGAEGALLDLKPLIDQYAPNIKKFIENDKGYEQSITTKDGKIFTIMKTYPSVPDYGWFYREDWANKLNIKRPETLDEFTAMLRLVKEKNPGGQKFFYPLTGQDYHLMNLVFESTFDYDYAGNSEDIYNPHFKEYIEYLNKLYTEKLFDPESAKGAISEDALKAKMINGNGFIFFRAYGNAEEYTLAAKGLDPNYSITTMPPLKPVHGDDRNYFRDLPYSRGNSVAVSKDAKDPVAVIKWLDFLFTQEGADLRNWGIEGKSYKIVDGKKQFIVSSEDIFGSDMNSTDPHWRLLIQGSFDLPTPSDYDAQIQLASPYINNLRKINEGFNERDSDFVLVTGDDVQRKADLDAVTKPLKLKWIADLVTGVKPLTEWDNFLKEMDKAGYKELLDIIHRSLIK